MSPDVAATYTIWSGTHLIGGDLVRPLLRGPALHQRERQRRLGITPGDNALTITLPAGAEFVAPLVQRDDGLVHRLDQHHHRDRALHHGRRPPRPAHRQQCRAQHHAAHQRHPLSLLRALHGPRAPPPSAPGTTPALRSPPPTAASPGARPDGQLRPRARARHPRRLRPGGRAHVRRRLHHQARRRQPPA